MNEDYVSYKIAKLLKEKGFDWKVFHFYDGDGHLKHREGDCYSLYNWNYPTKDEYGSQYCSAPTQQMACRWLREEHNILVCILHFEVVAGVMNYTYCIYRIHGDDYYFEPRQGRIKEAMDYEKAIEAGLWYVLKNLI